MMAMSRGFRAHLAASSIVLVAAIWLSTGTMAPYAATLEHPAVLEPCHELVNVDHDQFAAPFRMLRGDPRETWEDSVVLRRVLFPIAALPLVNLFGFLTGGVIASVILHVASMIGFAEFVRRRIGESSAIAVLWLLATYPGITYWAGLPYSYVMIVPGSLACTMLLYRLNEATNANEVVAASLLLGIVSLGYDFLPFFAPAAVLVLVYRRRIAWIVVSCALMLAPTLVVAALFIAIGVPVVNSNTVMYLTIVNAYVHPDIASWFHLIASLPAVFASNFVFSNFVILPLLFVAAMGVEWKRGIAALYVPDMALLLASLALFLFNNAAPPYYGWQMRGMWIARLYQPVFPAFLLAIARVTERLPGDRSWRLAVMASVILNATIAFGPVLLNPVAAFVDHEFYAHSAPQAMIVNLRRFGRRPLGVCSSSHAWDNIPDPNTPFNRPEFEYRYPPQ